MQINKFEKQIVVKKNFCIFVFRVRVIYMSRQSYRNSHALVKRFYNGNVFKCPTVLNPKSSKLCNSEKDYKILSLSYCSNDELDNESLLGPQLSHDKRPFREYFKFPPA